MAISYAARKITKEKVIQDPGRARSSSQDESYSRFAAHPSHTLSVGAASFNARLIAKCPYVVLSSCLRYQKGDYRGIHRQPRWSRGKNISAHGNSLDAVEFLLRPFAALLCQYIAAVCPSTGRLEDLVFVHGRSLDMDMVRLKSSGRIGRRPCSSVVECC